MTETYPRQNEMDGHSSETGRSNGKMCWTMVRPQVAQGAEQSCEDPRPELDTQEPADYECKRQSESRKKDELALIGPCTA